MTHKKIYEEQIKHNTKELPIALHQLSYPEGTDILFYLHWHKEFEFFVVTEGIIEFTMENKTYELKEGDCVFINSNLYHSAKSFNKQKCSFFAVDFSYEFLEPNIHTQFFRKYIRPILNENFLFCEIIHLNDTPCISWQVKVIRHLFEINECGEDNLISFELLLKSRIYTIWELYYRHGIVRKREEEKNFASELRLRPVITYIKKNYSYEITLSDLAQILPMSEGQFCRIFKKVMKVSPFQYIMHYRIMQSLNLLIETDKKISEIANLCGFNNISYYNKVFFKFIGCTPSEYRVSTSLL